jgi:hypothetical protein
MFEIVLFVLPPSERIRVRPSQPRRHQAQPASVSLKMSACQQSVQVSVSALMSEAIFKLSVSLSGSRQRQE